MFRKITALILVFALLTGGFPAAVFAAETAGGTYGDNITWTLDSAGTLRLSGGGEMLECTQITDIPWYDYQDSINAVVIDPGITSISKYAFYYCNRMRSVSIPGSVTSIGYKAFAYCVRLTDMEFPEGLQYLESDAFYNCTGLSSVYIPSTVTNLGEGVFSECNALEEILVSEDNSVFSSYDGLVYSKDLSELLLVPLGVTGEVQLAEGLTAIADDAFKARTGLTGIDIPDTVTSIGFGAMSECTGLVSITISEHIRYLGSGAFSGCTKLKEIQFNAVNLDDYNDGSNVFYNAGADGDGITVIFGANVTKIPAYLFYTESYDNGVLDTNIVRIVFEGESSCESIGQYAFYNSTKLTELTIPDRVSSIGYWAFGNCTQLLDVTLGAEMADGVLDAFDGCAALMNYYVAEENRSYSSVDGVLYNKSGTELVRYPCGRYNPGQFPDTVTSVGNEAFRDCVNIREIQLPNGVTAIGSSAFWECTNLSSVSIPDGVTAIGYSAFYGCTSLSSVTIPGSVAVIESGTFMDCSSLREVVISEGVEMIENAVFDYCTSLTSVTIPASVSSVGEIAGASYFDGCSKLEAIHVDPDNQHYCSVDGVLMSKDQTRLYICPPGKAGSYTVPDTVTFIRCWAFGSCAKLTDVTIADSVTACGNWLFDDCSSLTTVTLGRGITNIHGDFFGRCASLDWIIFRGDAPSFNAEAFKCWGDESLNVEAVAYYPAGNATWTADVMQDYGGTITWVPYLAEESTPNNGSYTSSQETVWYDIWCVGSSKIDPVTGFTLHAGTNTYPTGDDNRARALIPYSLLCEVSVTRDGYITCQIPAEMVYTCREIVMHPADTATPFVQYAAFRENGETWYTNLSVSRDSVAENSMTAYELFVDINWNGETAGDIWLMQGEKRIDLSEGKNDNLMLGGTLTYDGGDISLYYSTSSGDVYCQQLHLDVHRTSSTNITISGGDITSGINPNSNQEDEVWGSLKFAVDVLKDTVPVEVKLMPSSVNSGTFEATFGITIPVTEKKHILYDMIENGLNSDKLDGMDFKDAQKLIEQLEKEGAEVSVQANKFVIESKGKFLGYFTGVYTLGEDGNIVDMTFEDSGIMAGWEGEFTTARQHFTSGVPWFWELKAKIEAALKLKLNEEYDGTRASIAPAAAEAEIELGAGVAAGLHSIASIGVSGSGVAHVEGQILPFDADSAQIYANYKFNLGDFRVGPFNGTILSLESDKYYLLRDGVWFPDAQEQAQTSSWNLARTAEQTMQQTSRAYLSRGSVFNQSMALATGTARTVQNATANSWTIKTNTYTSAEPRIVLLEDGRLLMVWTDDPGTQVRPAAVNRAALYYSIYSEGAWSEPAMIHDDGTTDLAPVLKAIDGEIYLVWVNINAALAEDCSYEEFCAAMDIAYARFDSAQNVFTDISAVDTDEKTDTIADVTVVNGVPTVVWLRSDSSSLLIQEGAGTICAAQLVDGSWETAALCDGLQSVDKLYADNAENELRVFFAQDTDGDYATLHDRELFRASGSGVIRLTDNEIADLKPVIVNDEMYWYCDGALTDGTHTLTMADATDRYTVVTNGTSTAVLYHQIKEDNATTIYAHYLDENGWSDAVELIAAPGYITSFGAAMLPDGTLYIMANEIAAEGETLETANLMLYTAGVYTDLRVDSADYQALTLVPGGTLEIQAEVSNPGTARIDAVRVQMYQDDTLLHEVQMECGLAAGGSDTLSLEYPIAEDFAADAVRITILPDGQTDRNEADNTVTMPIYRSDVSVEEVHARRNGETTAVTAYIANRGLDALSDITVSVRGQTADAEVLATVGIDSIAAASGQVVCLEADVAEGDVVYVTAEIADAENVDANNAEFALVVPTDDTSVQSMQAHAHSYTVEQTAPTCTEQGYSTYTCQLCQYSYVGDYVAALDHTADESIPAVTVPAACETPGYTLYTCAACGSTYTTDYMDPLWHSWCSCGADNPSCPDCTYTASTCMEEGSIVYTCRRDGCTEQATTLLEYAPHTMDESMPGVTTAPTCTEQGYTTFVCAVCEAEVTDYYVSALGHDWCGCENENAACEDCIYTAATCTADGLIHYFCRRENCTEEMDVILKAGHTPDNSQTVDHIYYADCVCAVCGAAYVAWDDIRLRHMELPETGISSIVFSDGEYGWAWNETTERFESGNAFINSSTAQTTMQIHSTAAVVLSFDYGVSSESYFDCMDIVAEIGGEVVPIAEYISGIQTGTFSCELPAGETTLTFSYTKDSSVSYDSDVGWFSNLKLEQSESASSVTYTSVSISLAGDIGVNYYAQLSDDIVADAGAYMQFTVAGQTQIVPLREATVSTDADGVTTYRFSCKVAAKQMTEAITGQMYKSSGPVGEAKVYSVKAYCDAAIPVYGQYAAYADLVALMEAMLNYGGYSQVQFGYNTDNLANAGLDLALPSLTAEDVSAYAHGATGSEEGISVASVSLLLESTTTIRFYFNLDGSKSIDEYTFYVDGVETAPVQSGENQYYVDKVNVAAKDLDEMVTVTISGLTVQYCGLSYVRQVAVLYPTYYSAALVNVAKALYAYNQAANVYFG